MGWNACWIAIWLVNQRYSKDWAPPTYHQFETPAQKKKIPSRFKIISLFSDRLTSSKFVLSQNFESIFSISFPARLTTLSDFRTDDLVIDFGTLFCLKIYARKRVLILQKTTFPMEHMILQTNSCIMFFIRLFDSLDKGRLTAKAWKKSHLL